MYCRFTLGEIDGFMRRSTQPKKAGITGFTDKAPPKQQPNVREFNDKP
jgi:hypothetical protein